MIGIIDYGMGNLRSVQKALELFGENPVITSDYETLLKCDGIILPGVGAFPDAIDNIVSKNLDTLISSFTASGKPLLGICLGMQLLFEESDEVRICKGLGLLKGKITRLTGDFKIPHMGWNDLKIKKQCRILEGVEDGEFAYFVHSYLAVSMDVDDINAVTLYGTEVPAVVSKGNVYGTQFHPEKSGDLGMKILKNFIGLTKQP
ncbi:MAG: imidazole glycerol phosphate synthase subunit HisH [Clostridiaceae bacterium]